MTLEIDPLGRSASDALTRGLGSSVYGIVDTRSLLLLCDNLIKIRNCIASWMILNAISRYAAVPRSP
jgi:hypothetical protein